MNASSRAFSSLSRSNSSPLFCLGFLLSLWSAIVIALPAYAEGEKATLNFPVDRSIGTIKFIDDFKKRTVVGKQAQGKVVITAGSGILEINFNAASNLSVLKCLRPNDVHTLSFRKLEIKDDDLKHIAHLTGLSNLVLEQTDVTDAGLHYLSPLTSVVALCLRETLITGKGFADLKALVNLQELDVASNNLGEHGFDCFPILKSLQILNAPRTGITNSALVVIGKLPKLENLNLEYNKAITDDGIAALSQMKSLRILKLGDTSVTVGCTKHLAKLLQLRSVSLTASKFSPADLASMRKALPKCKVQDRLDSRGEQWKVDVFDQSKH